MISLRYTSTLLVLLATLASALPPAPKLTERQLGYYELARRQNEAAIALGLGDHDILQL